MSGEGFTAGIRTYSLELTKACNNDCLYCYNVWKGDPTHRAPELTTAEWKGLIDELVAQTGCQSLVLSGGEPSLRPDVQELIAHGRGAGCAMLMITNGARFADPELARSCVEAGCGFYEITLLSHRAEVHDRLVRNTAWADAIAGIRNLKALGARVAITFIATELNIPDIEPTLALAISLGADQLVLNRVVCSGEGVRHINTLLPDISSLYYALGVANLVGHRHGYKIASTIPIQPCLVYPSDGLFEHVTKNRCSVGTESGSYVIDPSGRVRPCSIASTILGDFRVDSMEAILNNGRLRDYVAPRPAMCTGCSQLDSCRGGCRAAAESCYGSPSDTDPFLRITASIARQRRTFPRRLK